MSVGVVRYNHCYVDNGQQHDVRNLFVECGVCRSHYRCTNTFNFYIVKDSDRYQKEHYWTCKICVEDELRLLGQAVNLEYVQSREKPRV